VSWPTAVRNSFVHRRPVGHIAASMATPRSWAAVRQCCCFDTRHRVRPAGLEGLGGDRWYWRRPDRCRHGGLGGGTDAARGARRSPGVECLFLRRPLCGSVLRPARGRLACLAVEPRRPDVERSPVDEYRLGLARPARSRSATNVGWPNTATSPCSWTTIPPSTPPASRAYEVEWSRPTRPSPLKKPTAAPDYHPYGRAAPGR
jgi:hypothetical protein